MSKLATWRDQLDARVSRCPGCGRWRWDRACPACDQMEAAA